MELFVDWMHKNNKIGGTLMQICEKISFCFTKILQMNKDIYVNLFKVRFELT